MTAFPISGEPIPDSPVAMLDMYGRLRSRLSDPSQDTGRMGAGQANGTPADARCLLVPTGRCCERAATVPSDSPASRYGHDVRGGRTMADVKSFMEPTVRQETNREADRHGVAILMGSSAVSLWLLPWAARASGSAGSSDAPKRRLPSTESPLASSKTSEASSTWRLASWSETTRASPSVLTSTGSRPSQTLSIRHPQAEKRIRSYWPDAFIVDESEIKRNFDKAERLAEELSKLN